MEMAETDQLAKPQEGAPGSEAGARGELRIHEFASRIFRNMRMLRVWVPAGYDAPGNDRKYPVQYLNDGQNLFDRETAYGGVEWEVDETCDRMMAEGKIPPLIVVGIDNAQKERIREYLPFRSLNPPVMRPAGRRYPDFLTKEVMPFVCARYRIARGAENTGLGGSSMGALIALYTAMTKPERFGKLLVESPSLFIANRRVIRESSGFRQWPGKIFMAIGTRELGREERDRKTVDDVRALELNIRRAGLGENRLRVQVEEGATHSEGAWAKRFPGAMEFLYGSQGGPET